MRMTADGCTPDQRLRESRSDVNPPELTISSPAENPWLTRLPGEWKRDDPKRVPRALECPP